MSVTVDSICRGELRLAQPRHGYRFNVDSIILADFIERTGTGPVGAAVDLGAGCGVVGLLIARRQIARRVLLVELQQELADLAAENVERNDLQGRVVAVHADLKQHAEWCRERVDLVLCNPPFHRRGSGRVSDCVQVAVAKHEIRCTLDDVVLVGGAVLRDGGALALIHPADRLEESLAKLRRRHLAPELLQRVRPLPQRKCNRVLVRAVKGGATMTPGELPDLVVESSPGVYSPQMQRVLREGELGIDQKT